MIEQVIDQLIRECRARGWGWNLVWSEAEECFYAYADGQGIGEFIEVKRMVTAHSALSELLEKMKRQP